MSWKRISKKELLSTPYTKMESWVLQRDSGDEHTYEIQISPDVVIVFAVRDDGHIVVLKQFFVGAQKYHYTVVAGMIDQGETPEEAACRELQEEAGIIAKDMYYLGSVSRAKKDTMILHSFIATGFSEVGEQSLEDDEDIDVMTMPAKEFVSLLRKGKIEDAPIAHTAYWALDHLGLL